ncbi:MAG: cupin domain-containing protein [Solirubrobacteraceae bacterium]|jgi:uncharacterized cupin superfamily protein
MNLLEPDWDAEVDAGAGTVLRAVRVGQHAGARSLRATLYEMDPGALVSPLHFHHANEELLFVLSGTPTLRTGPDSERTLEPGEIVAFLPGPNGTHQITNQSGTPARVLICSTSILPEVAEQPETKMLAIITADGLRLTPNTPTITA